MKLARLAMLCLVVTAASSAQTHRVRKPASPAPAVSVERASWPLETVHVEGNHNYTAAQILAVAGLRLGEIAGKPEFEAAHERLMATGAFDRVAYRFAPAKDGKGFDSTLEVTEMEQMYPLRFEDLPVTDAALRSWLKAKDPLFAPKIPATKVEIERYSQWITEYLAQQNFHEPVAGKLVPEGISDLIILFRPSKARAVVARTRFTNTGDLPAGLLQTAMDAVTVGIGYTEPQVRLLLDSTIRPLYEARGMLHVSFPKIATEPAKDVDGLDVNIQVEPGPVYKLGRVDFAGGDSPPEDLAKLANLKADKVANFDDVKAAQERIMHSLKRSGYLQANTEVKRSVNDSNHTVAITFQLTPGPQFTFGKLVVVGLDIESEPAIRKLWGLQPGKPFNVDYPDHFLNRIKEEGVFDNLKSTRAETKVNPNEHTADVTLYFNK